MKHNLFIAAAIMLAEAASALTYNGVSLQEDQSFTRTQCGTTNKNVVKEVSGMACSRVSLGYLWAVWDEGTNSAIAIRPDGSLALRLNLTGTGSRDDWEDICTGTYNGTPYLFIGAFGDNNCDWANNYKIHYLPEPTITSGTYTAAVATITFTFPDNACHNVETLMYDPIDQAFYIVDKIDAAAQSVYRLPFSTTYTSTQTLTFVCHLGLDGEKFDLATAGDISPSGRQVAIKNKKHILLWNRQGNESLSQTLARQPLHIKAYQEEEQGESFAWLTDSIFYTTSDSKSNTPVYCYARPGAIVPTIPTDNDNTNPSSPDDPSQQDNTTSLSNNATEHILPTEKQVINGRLYIFHLGHLYTPQGVLVRKPILPALSLRHLNNLFYTIVYTPSSPHSARSLILGKSSSLQT